MAHDLRSTKLKIFAFVLLIHSLSAFLVISICPQLGFSIFDFQGLYALFAKAGHYACMFLCGFLFISTSVAMNLFLLPKSYANYIYHIKYNHILLTIGISVAFFYLFGHVAFDLHIILWILGAYAGGSLLFQASKHFPSLFRLEAAS